MRVLIVSSYFHPGINEPLHPFILDEALALHNYGVEVHIARGLSSVLQKKKRESQSEGPYIHDFGERVDLSIISQCIKNLVELPIRSFFHPRVVLAILPYSWFIAKLVKNLQVDVIHANFAIPEGFAALLARKRTGTPLVISVLGHDVQSDPRTGYGALSKEYSREMVVKALSGADAIITGDRFHHDTVEQLVGRDHADRIVFLYPSINSDLFNPYIDGSKTRRNYTITPEQPVVLFARHLRPIYGAEYLIRAASKIVADYPNAIFLILGSGPLEQTLRSLCIQLGIDRNVIFVGNVRRAKMPQYYAASDIFCDPCIFGQGYSTFEALASGKPAIGFKKGQIKIEDGIDGFLVETGNIEEMADKIKLLIKRPDLRVEMGAKGRERMEKNFSSERRVKEILEVYQKVRSHVTTSLVSSREEPPQSRLLFSYGDHHRVWPLADSKNGVLYATVSQVRQSAEPVCKLLRSLDYGKSWNEVADFYAMDERNTTTGQPFVAKDGSVFVPVWNAGFYRNGVLWLAIYKSVDGGISWLKTFEDSQGSYGNHFFQSPEGNLYLGVGQGGGGSKGKVNFRPEKSYLLLSRDLGENWETILDVNYPTALYSGVALDNELLLVAAREKKSLFLSLDGGRTWKETPLGHTARNVSYLEELRKIVVSSNSALFISEDAIKWSKLNTPIKGLIMRYPTWYKGRLYMSAVGWHSYIVSTDLNTWALDFDVTKATGSNLGARMAILNDSIFIGDEANGTLIRARLPFNSDIPIDLFQQLKGNLDYLAFIAKYVIKRII